jgi:hypothetical protein
MTRRPARALQSERIRAADAAAILGLTLRGVQELALRGDLPGAAKIGKLWTFSERALRDYVRERESEARCPTTETSINAAAFGGSERPLTAAKQERAYERAMQKLLGDCATSGSTRSRPRRGASRRDHG